MNDEFKHAGHPIDAWSNKKCIELAFEDNFPATVRDLSVQKIVVERFLNFYLGARIQKGLKVQDIVFSAISIMPLHPKTEEFIFENIHFKDDGTLFYLSPEDKLQFEINNTKIDNSFLNIPSTSKDNENQVFSETFNTDNNCMTNTGQVRTEQTSYELPLEYEDTNQDDNNTVSDEDPNDQESTATIDSTEEIPELPTNIRWSGVKRLRPVNEEIRQVYGPAENSAFTTSCNRLLAKWETEKQNRIILKYLFGVIALTLMRATTKTYKHLVNTFSSNKFLGTIGFAHPYLKFFVPHKRCIKTSHRTFGRRAGNTRIMFAKIVVCSFHIDALIAQQEQELPLNIFKVTLLGHTADYGLGIICLLETIVRRVGNDRLNDVLKSTYCAETAASWNLIRTFFDKYMVITSKEKTYRWARVIDHDYFKNLSCKSNYVLSVIFGVFIERLTSDSGIWKSTWVETDNAHHTDCKLLGISMYKQFEQLKGRSMKVAQKDIESLFNSLSTLLNSMS